MDVDTYTFCILQKQYLHMTKKLNENISNH